MDLKALSQTYIDVLNKVGCTPPDQIQEALFPRICADICEKIINGVSLYHGGENFLNQLREVREFAGPFEVVLQETIAADQNQMSAIRYDLHSEKEGSFQTSAFLSFDEKGHLIEINEVCCKTS